MRRFPLSRRTFLRGAGITMALPLLDAMLDDRGMMVARIGAQPTPVPKVLGSFFLPNGAYPPRWFPASFGEPYPSSPIVTNNWELTPSLASLAPFKSDIVVFSGFWKNREFSIGYEHGGGDAHMVGTGTAFTGTGLTPQGAAGPTFDQVAANALWNEQTARKSIAVALGRESVHLAFASWSSADQPLPPLRSPTALFDHLFPGASDQRPNRTAYRRSVLDYVKGDAEQLRARLGAVDCQRIERYFTSVRELETQLDREGSGQCEIPPRPEDGEELTNERARLLLRLLALALECDVTRYFSFQLATRWDNRRYPWLNLGVEGPADQADPRGHHSISHMTTPEGLEAYARIAQDEVEQFAFFLDLLKNASHGESSLLDHAAIVLASEHGWTTSNGHDFGSIPCVLAGRGGGTLKTGLHCRAVNYPYANVLVTALHAAGVPELTLGVAGNGVIAPLLA